MIGSRVSRRYARALFLQAQENKLIDTIEKDLSDVKEIVEKSKEFSAMILSPVIPSAEKKKIFTEIFEKKIHPLSLNFLYLLLNKGREKFLLDTIWNFSRLIDDYRGIVRGQLFSAYPLNPNQMEELKKKLDRITGKNVQLTQQVDSSLIGGFVVKLDDTIIDSSIRNQLVKMKDVMISP